MNFYHFKQEETIILPKKADSPCIKDILQNYTHGVRWNITFAEDDCHIYIGTPQKEERKDFEYVINISLEGIYIEGESYKDTIHGFVSLMELIFCYGRKDYRAECSVIRDKAALPFRSVHICFFPDNTIQEMQKVIRTCGMAKYSHIVLEFWGNLKFDAMKELSWPEGYTKEEIKPLIEEANALGIEIIPFYQHLGHAAMSRLGYSGKHVVLDQDIQYDYLYYPKSRGWVWNYNLEETKELLRKVRQELMELCGQGQYFHLGCDEAGLFFDTDQLSYFLNEVSGELKAQGRQAIIWGDMLLSHDFQWIKTENADSHYECNSSGEYALELLRKLDRNIIIADWQYNAKEHPWKTSVFFKEQGFKVICCPWNHPDNIYSAVHSAREENLEGIMETTWNKLFNDGGIYRMVFAGLCAWGDPDYSCWFSTIAERTYNMYRRVSPPGQTYKSCGWSETQV